jgi:hypothetical protein
MNLTKKTESRLDPYAAELEAMEEAQPPKTLAEMQAWLAGKGCAMTVSAIGRFLARLRAQREQERLLHKLGVAVEQCRVLEKWFKDNPAPDLGLLVKLFKVLILQLTVESEKDPSLLKMANELAQTALKYIKSQDRAELGERTLALAEEKFRFDATNRCIEVFPRLLEVYERSQMTDGEKTQAIRKILFTEPA